MALVEILEPEFLIMDEISNGLDYEMIRKLQKMIKHWASHTTILLTGHLILAFTMKSLMIYLYLRITKFLSSKKTLAKQVESWGQSMMKKFFEQEIRYGVNSKLYYSMTVFLIVLFGVTLFLNYSSVMDTYNDYQSTIDYYEKNDLDIEADLKSGYEIEENQKGGMIKNPIAYHKENVGRVFICCKS